MSGADDRPDPAGRAVLIDMDDTIFDHSLTCRTAIASLRRTRSFLRRRPLDDLWGRYLELLEVPVPVLPDPGQWASRINAAREERWRRIALHCGATLSTPEVAELSQAYRALYQRHRRPVPGALDLLRRLHREARVVVVTNNEVAEQEEKVRFLGIGGSIDGLVVSEAVGASKPDPRIFEVALQIAGVGPGVATMFGDSWTNDVLGARAAGIRSVWFNRFGRPSPADRAVPEVRSLRPVSPAARLLLGSDRGPPAGSEPERPSGL